MNEAEFKARTMQIGLRAMRVAQALPQEWAAQHVGHQLLRSATSVGANYRAACRGRSPADVIAKLKIVEEEADESLYWMEILLEAGLMSKRRIAPLMQETDEVLAMVVASIKTLRARYGNRSQRR